MEDHAGGLGSMLAVIGVEGGLREVPCVSCSEVRLTIDAADACRPSSDDYAVAALVEDLRYRRVEGVALAVVVEGDPDVADREIPGASGQAPGYASGHG